MFVDEDIIWQTDGQRGAWVWSMQDRRTFLLRLPRAHNLGGKGNVLRLGGLREERSRGRITGHVGHRRRSARETDGDTIACSSGDVVGEGATVARKGYKSAGRHAGAPQSDGGRNGQLVEEAHD